MSVKANPALRQISLTSAREAQQFMTLDTVYHVHLDLLEHDSPPLHGTAPAYERLQLVHLNSEQDVHGIIAAAERVEQTTFYA